MADNFDKLLFSLGAEADGKVPYADAFEKIKAKTELERARRLKRSRSIRLLSIAASFVVVLGVGTVLLTNGFFTAGKAAPEAASAGITAACCEPREDAGPQSPMAPAPAALYDAPPADNSQQSSPEPSELPMLGIAPAGGTEEQNGEEKDGALGDDAQVDNRIFIAGAPEAVIFVIGLPKTLPSPTDAVDKNGYTLQMLTSDEAPCEIGEAAIYQLDDITLNALWRIAQNDYISITVANMSTEDLVSLMEGLTE